MRSTELKKAKRDVRRRVLAARDAIDPGERSRLGARIVERVVALDELDGATTVLAFWSFGSEVPTAPLLSRLAAAAKIVVLPRIAGSDLEARRWSPGDALTATTFGAMEPAAGGVVRPDLIDLVITPGVAFDLAGRRIGYGGGFYDRLFPLVRPACARVAIAFDEQLVDEDLPAGAFDLPMQVIVTPSRTIRVPPT